jgi:hypothetical protein
LRRAAHQQLFELWNRNNAVGSNQKEGPSCRRPSEPLLRR